MNTPATSRGPSIAHPATSPARLRSRLLVPVLAALLVSTLACDRMLGERIEGSGAAVTEERSVSSFSAVHMSTSGNLRIERADERSLSITADDNILPLLTSTVEDGTLRLEVEDDVRIDPETPIEYRIRTPRIEDVALAGSGDVDLGGFDGERLGLSIAGSGDIRARDLAGTTLRLEIDGSGEGLFRNISFDHLDLEVDGSGSFEVSGRADRQTVDIAGSGDFLADSLAGRSVRIRIAGSGNARVQAADSLDVRIGGSGDVRYTGNPVVSQRISGSGSVRPVSSD